MESLNNIIGVEQASKILDLSPGTIKNKCAQGQIVSKKIGKTWVIDKEKLYEYQKERMKMKVWNRDTYVVVEKEFDGDLHEFDITRGDETLATITPETIEDMHQIIEDLDNGEDVHGWEDGNGNTIDIK